MNQDKVSRMNIYLAGYIYGQVMEECKAWRKQIRNYYENWKSSGNSYPLNLIDPINGEEHHNISEDGLKSDILPSNAIVHKDIAAILKSDLVIANMNTFGMTRPPIGTICEVTIAYEHKIPIIMISDEKNYVEHPFLKYFSSWIVKDVEELLEKKIINIFYKSWNSAIYE